MGDFAESTQPEGVRPMPVPMGTGEVVLFGGTFDPPTRAHIEVGVRARDTVAGPGGGAWLVFVPAARSPFKGASAASEADRVAMLELATQEVERAGVWTDEIDRTKAFACAKGSGAGGCTAGGPSYWVETVQRARGVLGEGVRLWFVIGADQAGAFHKWRAAREIVACARPIVVLREPVGSIEELERMMRASGFWTETELTAWRGAVVDIPMQAGSATQVREALKISESAEVLEDLLDPRVLGYIREHGLYRG